MSVKKCLLLVVPILLIPNLTAAGSSEIETSKLRMLLSDPQLNKPCPLTVYSEDFSGTTRTETYLDPNLRNNVNTYDASRARISIPYDELNVYNEDFRHLVPYLTEAETQ